MNETKEDDSINKSEIITKFISLSIIHTVEDDSLSIIHTGADDSIMNWKLSLGVSHY